jgi:hypothetical protein
MLLRFCGTGRHTLVADKTSLLTKLCKAAAKLLMPSLITANVWPMFSSGWGSRSGRPSMGSYWSLACRVSVISCEWAWSGWPPSWPVRPLVWSGWPRLIGLSEVGVPLLKLIIIFYVTRKIRMLALNKAWKRQTDKQLSKLVYVTHVTKRYKSC